ncbi:metallophosphoesterase [Roseomonas sp. CAU 1739]|uniref:metallophosphoesterase family protein n=1 Tax=Roseomonas sp. CAU 1739 TaxID=3140364 RepID=UPI00325BC507
MIRIAHLSDLHFGAHRPELVSPLVEDIARFAPDAIAISGDLTQRAQQAEFIAAAAFIAALPAPVVAVPGNHDIPAHAIIERMFDPRRRWRRVISGTTEPVLMLPGLALIGVDTVRRAQPHLDWSAGGLSAARLARLATRIEAAADRTVVVVAHHPLRHPAAAVGRASPIGAQPALALMRQVGVAAILSGHLHVSAQPIGEPPVMIVGSSLSVRVRGVPNAWSLVEVGDGPPRRHLRVTDGARWRDASED